jgi:hypothetical protein
MVKLNWKYKQGTTQMSNKSQYIKPSLDYRKAKVDYVRAFVGFLIVLGIMFVLFAATLVMAVPEQ